MRGDDSETLRLSRDRAGGVDTQKKKTIAKNNIWQENTIFTVQRAENKPSLQMPDDANTTNDFYFCIKC